MKELHASCLVYTIVLNTKMSEVDNKMPNLSGLVTTTVWILKLVELRVKFLIMINILLLQNLTS